MNEADPAKGVRAHCYESVAVSSQSRNAAATFLQQ
jgi:hypothetical protein